MKMQVIEYKGKEIKTNYNPKVLWNEYPMGRGNDKKNYYMILKDWVLRDGDKYKHQESDREFFDRLVEYGYTTIRFEQVSTMVRGLHDTIAYVK